MAIARKKFFFKKGILKEGYQKALKNLIFFFLSNPVSFNGKVIKNKRGLKLVISRSSGHETTSEKILYSLYIIWPSLMMSCKIVFELFQKLHLQIYASQCIASEIIPLPFVFLNLESVERKGKNYKNLNISRTKRAF